MSATASIVESMRKKFRSDVDTPNELPPSLDSRVGHLAMLTVSSQDPASGAGYEAMPEVPRLQERT